MIRIFESQLSTDELICMGIEVYINLLYFVFVDLGEKKPVNYFSLLKNVEILQTSTEVPYFYR